MEVFLFFFAPTYQLIFINIPCRGKENSTYTPFEIMTKRFAKLADEFVSGNSKRPIPEMPRDRKQKSRNVYTILEFTTNLCPSVDKLKA